MGASTAAPADATENPAWIITSGRHDSQLMFSCIGQEAGNGGQEAEGSGKKAEWRKTIIRRRKTRDKRSRTGSRGRRTRIRRRSIQDGGS